MCLLLFSIYKQKYFVSYLELKLFAASEYSHSVSGQLPTTWVLTGAGASLWFSYYYVQPGVSWFSSAVLRSRGCSSACLWLMVLFAFGSDSMDEWVFGDTAHFRSLCYSALDVLWLCTDVACKSGYVFEPDRCLVAAVPVMGPVMEIWNERLKVTNSTQSKLNGGERGHFRISSHQWVALQWSSFLSFSKFSP